MSDGPREGKDDMAQNRPDDPRFRLSWVSLLVAFAAVAGLTILLAALLTNIFERKQEARQPFVRLVEVTDDIADPKVWGQNWPVQYDSYLKTSLPTATKYGGGRSTAGRPSRSSTRSPGSSASSLATPSPSTTGTAAGTSTASSTRSRPAG
jgi:hypothetical protein